MDKHGESMNAQKIESIFKFVIIMSFAVIVYLVGTMYISLGISDDKLVDTNFSQFMASTYTDSMEVMTTVLSVDMGKYDALLSLGLSDSIILAADNYGDYGYIAYQSIDENDATEIILSKDIPAEISLTEDELSVMSDRNILQSITYDESTLTLIEKTGLKIEEIDGYVFVINHVVTPDGNKDATNINSIELTGDYDKDIENMDTKALKLITTIDNVIIYSKNKEKQVLLDIDGLGNFDLNQISDFDGNAGYSYQQDRILRLYNHKENKVYAGITNIDTSEIDGLIEVDGWNNLYKHIDSDKIDSDNYGMFGIQTSKGFYRIQLTESASDTFAKQLIEMFGIKPDDEKIESSLLLG